MVVFTPADLERFLAADDGEPVVMLNLLRFRPDGGRDTYFEYIALAQPVLARHGGTVVYVGDGGPALAAEPGQSWDVVALVRYPTRAAFAAMLADPEYQKAEPLRAAALTEAVLQPTRSLG